MKQKIKYLIVTIVILISAKFWLGIYEDDEFREKNIFIKHRPIWKTFFYSPRGMSDLEISQMSKEDKKEQLLFDEFITENHYKN